MLLVIATAAVTISHWGGTGFTLVQTAAGDAPVAPVAPSPDVPAGPDGQPPGLPEHTPGGIPSSVAVGVPVGVPGGVPAPGPTTGGPSVAPIGTTPTSAPAQPYGCTLWSHLRFTKVSGSNDDPPAFQIRACTKIENNRVSMGFEYKAPPGGWYRWELRLRLYDCRTGALLTDRRDLRLDGVYDPEGSWWTSVPADQTTWYYSTAVFSAFEVEDDTRTIWAATNAGGLRQTACAKR